MLRYTAPVALTLFLACTVSAQTTRADADGPLDRALIILQRLDDVTASVNYADTSLADVIEDLNWFIDVPLTADWEALALLGIDAETELTLRLEDVPLASVLAAVALQLGRDFDRPRVEVFEASMLVLTSEDETERMRMTDVYDVRDLLADGRAAPDLRRTSPSRADTETPGDSGETGAPTASDEEDEPARGVTTRPGWRIPARDDEDAPPAVSPTVRRMSPGEELMTLICEHVDPQAWIEFGGTRASITERDGILMVSAAPTLHRGLRDALRRLRSAYATFVAIDAAIVDAPRDLYERLTRRLELSSAALGRALLAASETQVVWRAAAGVTPEKPLTFESRGDKGLVTIELLPAFDRANGVLTIAVKASSRHEGDERSVSTTVSIPYRQGGATIELPASAPGEIVRLLVLIPTR